MTKVLKTTLLSITFILVILVLMTGYFMETSLVKSRAELNQINIRKEELLNLQQDLAARVESLNSTLQNEILRNDALRLQLQQVGQDRAAAIAQAEQAAAKAAADAAAAAAQKPTPPAPVVVSKPKTVTRAS